MITVTNYRGTRDMGRFSVDVRLANNRDVGLAEAGVIPKEKVRSTQIKGIVDAGAAMLVLPG
jgi:hypothetical protein